MDQRLLHQLQSTWPETTSYLRRVGQVQNDLMLLREMVERQQVETAWLDELAIEDTDLTEIPEAIEILRFLWARGRRVASAAQVPEYQALREEQEALFQAGDESTPEILEDPSIVLPESVNARLWALPELQTQVETWAAETVQRLDPEEPRPSLTQATMLLQLVRVLEQEPEQSPEWAEACLRSALSSNFYQQTGNPPQTN